MMIAQLDRLAFSLRTRVCECVSVCGWLLPQFTVPLNVCVAFPATVCHLRLHPACEI